MSLRSRRGSLSDRRSGVALATNLARNPSLEVDTTDWVNTDGASMILDGATIVRSTAQAFNRTASLQVDTASSGQGTALVVPGTFASGQPYTASVYVKVITGTAAIRLIFGDRVGDWTIPSDFTATTTFQRFTASWTPAASRTNVALAIRSQSGLITIYADAAMVETGSSATAYFDGASANSAWRGAADASISDRFA